MKFNVASRRASKILYAAEHDAKRGWLRISFLRADGANLREIAARREGRCEAELATCYFCGADGAKFCDFKI